VFLPMVGNSAGGTAGRDGSWLGISPRRAIELVARQILRKTRHGGGLKVWSEDQTGPGQGPSGDLMSTDRIGSERYWNDFWLHPLPRAAMAQHNME
jgi:hypothetical protein